MRRFPVMLLLLLLTGCAAAILTTHLIAPTLEVTNGTDDQLNVSVEGRVGTIARIRPLSTACVRLTALPPGDAVLVFRALGRPRGIRAQPSNYSMAPGWALTIAGTTTDGGFFASAQAHRCRG